MRYYKLTLTDASGKPLNLSSLAGAGMGDGIITSLRSDGSTNPAALNIEIDITQYNGHNAGGDSRSYVRIWGLSLKDISQSFNYSGGTIKVEAGMAKGYPLADPSQQGTLVKGTILQAFGNWMGTDMTLDLILGTDASTPTAPTNYTFHWDKGEPLSAMVGRVLKQNFSDLENSITLGQGANRVAPQDLWGQYQTFTQFAQWVNAMTATPGKDDGVVMSNNGTKIVVTENPNSPNALGAAFAPSKPINFSDLLGQVTWYGPQQITAKLVMRGDLDPNQIVKFPAGLISTVTAQSLPAYGGTARDQNTLAFSGTYMVMQMQHWGNFRQPDALAWNTTIWCSQQSGTATAAQTPTTTSTGSGSGP